MTKYQIELSSRKKLRPTSYFSPSSSFSFSTCRPSHKGAVFSSDDCVLTKAIWDSVVEWKLNEFDRKQGLLGTARAAARTKQAPRQRNSYLDPPIVLGRPPTVPQATAPSRLLEASSTALDELKGASETVLIVDEEGTQGNQRKSTCRELPTVCGSSQQDVQAAVSPRNTALFPVITAHKSYYKAGSSKGKSNQFLYLARFSGGKDGESSEQWCTRSELLEKGETVLRAYEASKGIVSGEK